jgi:peptidyl-prolyl cis-trans isomerase A (cyclophilin A)
MNKYIYFFCIILFSSCTQKKYTSPHLLISTGYGDIEVELYPDKAPKTVAAFLGYVDAGMYKNSSFYRVIKNDNLQPEYNSGLIQGGIYKSDPQKLLQLPGIEHEPPAKTGLSHTDGTLSLARTTAGTGRSEFFICIGDQVQFDSSRRTNPDGLGFAAFGKVVQGMQVVRAIQNRSSSGDAFDAPITINNITRL